MVEESKKPFDLDVVKLSLCFSPDPITDEDQRRRDCLKFWFENLGLTPVFDKVWFTVTKVGDPESLPEKIAWSKLATKWNTSDRDSVFKLLGVNFDGKPDDSKDEAWDELVTLLNPARSDTSGGVDARNEIAELRSQVEANSDKLAAKESRSSLDVLRVRPSSSLSDVNLSPSEWGKAWMVAIRNADNHAKTLSEVFPADTKPTENTDAYAAFATAIASAGTLSETKYQAEVMNPAMKTLVTDVGFDDRLVVEATMSNAYLTTKSGQSLNGTAPDWSIRPKDSPLHGLCVLSIVELKVGNKWDHKTFASWGELFNRLGRLATWHCNRDLYALCIAPDASYLVRVSSTATGLDPTRTLISVPLANTSVALALHWLLATLSASSAVPDSSLAMVSVKIGARDLEYAYHHDVAVTNTSVVRAYMLGSLPPDLVDARELVQKAAPKLDKKMQKDLGKLLAGKHGIIFRAINTSLPEETTAPLIQELCKDPGFTIVAYASLRPCQDALKEAVKDDTQVALRNAVTSLLPKDVTSQLLSPPLATDSSGAGTGAGARAAAGAGGSSVSASSSPPAAGGTAVPPSLAVKSDSVPGYRVSHDSRSPAPPSSMLAAEREAYKVFNEAKVPNIPTMHPSSEDKLVLSPLGEPVLPGTPMSSRPFVSALAKIHSLGWVHGDLRPPNLIQTTDGKALLIDFGRSCKVGDATCDGKCIVFGSPNVRGAARKSLETLDNLSGMRDRKYTPLDDLWALALTLNCLMTPTISDQLFGYVKTARTLEAQLLVGGVVAKSAYLKLMDNVEGLYRTSPAVHVRTWTARTAYTAALEDLQAM